MCTSGLPDIFWNIFGGVLSAVVFELGRAWLVSWRYRRINQLGGLYHVFINGADVAQLWIRLNVSNSLVELTGGRIDHGIDQVTFEGQLVFQSADASSATGYYIDHFSNTDSPEYIGNGKFYIKLIDKKTIRVSAIYYTNKTADGKTRTVMVRADEIWKKQ
jgi:hypothetical protein